MGPAEENRKGESCLETGFRIAGWAEGLPVMRTGDLGAPRTAVLHLADERDLLLHNTASPMVHYR